MYILTDYRLTDKRLTIDRPHLSLVSADPSGTALAKTSSNSKFGPSSRQRGRYKIINPQLSKENFKEKEKLVADPRWVPDTKTDWPAVCRS
jgi:hypothetical protein